MIINCSSCINAVFSTLPHNNKVLGKVCNPLVTRALLGPFCVECVFPVLGIAASSINSSNREGGVPVAVKDGVVAIIIGTEVAVALTTTEAVTVL